MNLQEPLFKTPFNMIGGPQIKWAFLNRKKVNVHLLSITILSVNVKPKRDGPEVCINHIKVN